MTIKNLTFEYGIQTIFEDVNLYIPNNSKIGVVGINGAGKSTLFNILTGKIDNYIGKIIFENNVRIELLPQIIDDEVPDKNITVFDFLSSARPIKKLEEDLQKCYEKVANCKDQDEIFKKIENIEKKLKYWDYYEADTILIKIIEGMNIGSLLDKKLNELSGGQKSKIAFARLLYLKPEIILLDEPTNHLDKETKDYVINYLKHYKGSVFIISHDVSFLNQIIDKVLFIDKRYHSISLFNGDYNSFIKQNNLKEEAINNQAKKDLEEEQKLRKIVEKYKTSSGKRKKMAQDREKKLEKLLQRKTNIVLNNKEVVLDVKQKRESTRYPIKVDNISFKYDKESNVNVINNLSFEIYRGEKFLIEGKNGVGKSTLIKLLAGILTPDSGTILRGIKTDIGYYAQEHELLDLDKTIFENFSELNLTNNKIRSVLGKFLFFDDEVFKKVCVLSPGERSRVALAKLSISGSNLLLLDEPTNHLDPETQKIIAEAFKDFNGTMLVVSHNKEFINNLGIKRSLKLPEGKIVDYEK